MFADRNIYLMAIGALDGWKSVLILLAIVIPVGMWLAAIVDIVKHQFKNSTYKLLWLLIVSLIPVIGPLLYAFIGTKQKIS